MSKIASERNQKALLDLVTQPGNNACADCHAHSPRWASWNLGIFICVHCAAVHRKIGTHVTKVKSLTMDSWTKEQVETMRTMGNANSNALYNPDETRFPPPANLMESERDSELEKYIRSKYEFKKFMTHSSRAASLLGPSRSRSDLRAPPARSQTAPIAPAASSTSSSSVASSQPTRTPSAAPSTSTATSGASLIDFGNAPGAQYTQPQPQPQMQAAVPHIQQQQQQPGYFGATGVPMAGAASMAMSPGQVPASTMAMNPASGAPMGMSPSTSFMGMGMGMGTGTGTGTGATMGTSYQQPQQPAFAPAPSFTPMQAHLQSQPQPQPQLGFTGTPPASFVQPGAFGTAMSVGATPPMSFMQQPTGFAGMATPPASFMQPTGFGGAGTPQPSYMQQPTGFAGTPPTSFMQPPFQSQQLQQQQQQQSFGAGLPGYPSQMQQQQQQPFGQPADGGMYTQQQGPGMGMGMGGAQYGQGMFTNAGGQGAGWGQQGFTGQPWGGM